MKISLVIVIQFIVITVRGFPSSSNSGRTNEIANTQAYQWKTLDGRPTTLFAHRGEKTLLPEHTLPGYETASILQADYVEPDLCLTKDDQFVCHHDLFIRDGTDVEDHPEFDHLKRMMEDGSYNWFIRDFSLAELKTLRVRQQNIGIRPMDYNGFFSIPTFQEYLETIHRMTRKLNRTIGIVPELKNPAYHNENRSANNMEMLLLEILSNNGYPVNTVEDGNCHAEIDGQKVEIKCPPVVIQCFEFPPLKYLKSQCDFPLFFLVEEDTVWLTPSGIREASAVAQYFAVWKEYLYVGVEADLKYNNRTWDPEVIAGLGGFVPAQDFPTLVHEHGMRMGIYTIHDSREPSTRGCATIPGCEPEDKEAELNYYFRMGVDGIFIENVAESVAILKRFECDGVKKENVETVEVKPLDRESGGQKRNMAKRLVCLVMGYYCENPGPEYSTE